MNKEPKYYFVYYDLNVSTTRSRNNYTVKSQKIIDIHPIQWQIKSNEKYADWHKKSEGEMRKEECLVISWQKLTVEEYKEFKDKVG